MSEEITNTWELAELLERYAKILKKASKLVLKDYYSLEEIETVGIKTIEELQHLFLIRSDISVMNIFYERFVKNLKELKEKEFEDLKPISADNDTLIHSETFQMYGTDLRVPEPEDIEISQHISPVCYRCKCCKSYFDFDEFDKDGKCPHCHGKTKIGDKIYECDDTEVVD